MTKKSLSKRTRKQRTMKRRKTRNYKRKTNKSRRMNGGLEQEEIITSQERVQELRSKYGKSLRFEMYNKWFKDPNDPNGRKQIQKNEFNPTPVMKYLANPNNKAQDESTWVNKDFTKELANTKNIQIKAFYNPT